ncbi:MULTISPECIES: DUF6048 family protein [Maribacter]|uniref:DUF6048 family protein n=1 Tax=Maribacter flavus TaxID=1658664 RepID=A0ABU7IMF1_9FLAO|nr:MULTISPECIES: DUF6048 family protein [Maribacter]MDC6407021.1 DUF6048 family protein [Maribacter sp. PR66]MEE1974136.1 DUF6048 family protein [Maribacter flavus]
MSKYFINSLFLSGLMFGFAQSKPIDTQPKDTVEYKQAYGLRAGIDLSRPLISALDENYTGFEIVADYRLTEKLYLAAELGTEDKTKQEDLYNFTTTGSYLKLGFDNNTYENWYGEQNLLYYGGRLAFSSFSQTLNNYQYFNSNRYWNPTDFVEGSNIAEEFSGRSAVWIEALFGTKVELFANIFLGASVRLGILVSNSDGGDDRFPNLWIPGFNKVTDGTRFGVGYNYSISYFLPLYKKKKQPKELEPEQ